MMKRREFITLLGGEAAGGTQQTAMPMIGFLNRGLSWEYAQMDGRFPQRPRRNWLTHRCACLSETSVAAG